MKKSLSVVLSVALVSSMFASMAFADGATTTSTSTSTSATATTQLDAQGKYDALKALGVFEGDENGANLEGNMTRAQFAKILVKVFGLTEDPASASVYKDLDGAGWAAGYIGAATKAGLMDGVWEGQFAPSGDVTLEQLATVVVRGFNLDHSSTDGVTGASDWAKGYVKAAVGAGLISATADFTVSAKRSDLVNTAYTSVQKVKEEQAAEAAKQAAALDVSSAVALNSKVVQVTLATASKAADLIASNATVKDAAGTAVAVSGIVAAPWATDGKTVLVTLGADTTAGTLYTVTSGTKSANFGGKAADSAKPTVSSVTVVDYNIVDVAFSEPVDISSLAITSAQKYGTQTALAIKSTAYKNSTTVRLTTDDQAAATLYGLSISGAKDFAGNTMDANTAQTFVGIAKSTAKETVSGASASDYKTVVVKFGTKVDTSAASLAAANFAVAQAYGTQTAVAVDSVRAATTSDTYNGAALKTDNSASDVSYYLVVTLKDALSASTLYKLTVSNVGTTYGQPIDTANNTATFVGMAAPTSLTFNATPAQAASNTTINVKFANKMDKASAETIANYAIAETYGSKNALAVTAAALQSDGVTVKLTVAPMSASLYTLTVNNVKDVYGNSIKTDSSANVTTFVGAAVATKISGITAATLDSSNAGYGVLKLQFNRSVGASATDVSHYSIDGGIGYPQKVALVSGTTDSVNLTIPTTNNGQIYNVTVTGLENSDGVQMDAAGVKTSFVGAGVTAANPSLTAAIALDSQTVEVYFDQAVSSTKITGQIWDSGNKKIYAGKLQFTGNGAAVDLNSGNGWVDPNNANAIIVRFATAQFATGSAATNGTFTLNTVDANATALFAANKNSVVFAANGTAVVAPSLSGVMALNKSTVRVYFNQAVSPTPALTVYTGFDATNKVGTGTAITLSNGVAADTTKTVWDFNTSATLDGQTTPYYIVVANAADVKDVSGVVNAKDENSAVGVKQYRQFAGSSAAVGQITSVPVTMTDDRTIVVWYPEAMNAAASSIGSYSVYGSTASDATALAANIANVVASTDGSNKVTITLSAALPTSTNYYLQIGTGVKNAVANKPVQTSSTDASALRTQFAPSTVAAAKVTVSSATYSTTDNTVTITLNQKVKGDSTYNNFANDFTLYLNGDTANAVTPASAAVASANVVTINGVNYFTKITVTLPANAVTSASAVGTVAVKSTNNLVGIDGYAVDTASKVVFAQQ